MTVHYAFGKTVFGITFIAVSKDAVLQISFVPVSSELQEIRKIKSRWPEAAFQKMPATWAQEQLEKLIPQEFSENHCPEFQMLEQGTPFQNKVWKALMEIPPGRTSFYSDIAEKIGHPKAVRAVGSAVGANPIGYLIPCHRVLPKSGGIGHFGWGPDLKKRMLQFEKAL